MSERSDLLIVAGRGLNNLSDTYKMPADVEEMQRLDLQHEIWKNLFGGLYPIEAESIVRGLLDGKGAGSPAILDVGSGSGIWAVDMARKYPLAKVIGVDLARSKRSDIPKNCSFRSLNILDKEETASFIGHFDVIHCRLAIGHFVDDVGLAQEICSFLKPGGIVFLADTNADVYSSRGVLYDLPDSTVEATVTTTKTSWLKKWFSEFTLRVVSTGRMTTQADRLDGILQSIEGLTLVDKMEYWCPCNYEVDETRGEELQSALYREITLAAIDGMKPMLLSSGVEPDAVEDWAERARLEIRDTSFPIFFKAGAAWAVKKECIDQVTA